MALSPGMRLGPYEVQSAIGAGGMGEVYRARDTKLGRDVAIKVLPDAVATDPERLGRFHREAQVLASLNHPNIAAIYGFEDANRIHALVMELVEGPTLADLIAKSAIPLIEALTVAKQIAEALETAHDRGIIHRDLKPANIKVRDDGTVKVLDFGLAKVAAQDIGQTDLTHSPTAVTATRAGVILGTAAYMSPEQARGKGVDKRSDVWAFGCVLYEMLAGCRPFGGESVVDVLASILEREPDWSLLPTGTPETLRLLVQRCLAKDPRQRLRDIGDARLELSHTVASRLGDHRAGNERAAPRTRPSAWLLAAGAGGAVLALGVIAIVLVGRANISSRAATEPPLQLTDFSDSVVMPALSHDGRMLAFIRGTDFGRTAPTAGRVYVKLLPNGDPVELTRAEGGGFPIFSPDDSRVVYTVVMPGLKWDSWQVPVLGGSPQPFLANASGLNWVDGQRLVYSYIESGLHMGIVTSDLSQTDTKAVYLPASRGGMAHRSFPSPDRSSLLVVEMDRGTWQPCRLVPLNGSSPGRPVGPQRAECTSTAWSPDGRWMYFSSNAGGAFHIWRQRYPDGEPEQITFGPTEQEGTAMTPDGKYLITAMGLYRATIWMHNASGERQLTDSGYAVRPAMAPSGNRLFYLMRTEASQGQASGELWSTDLNSRSQQRLFPGLVMTHFVLSQDEKRILFTSSGHAGGDGIWIADLDRRTPPRQLTRNAESRAFFGAPEEIVYMSNDGRLYRMHEDGSGAEMISPDPLVYLMAVSPDGLWAGVITPAPENGGGTRAELRSLRGRGAIEVCNARCGLGPASLRYTSPVTWSLNGKWLFVSLGFFREGARRTIILPYRSDVPPDRLWPRGLTSEDGVAANPGARVVENSSVFPASDPETYLTWRPSFQSNLYRIRLSN